MIVVPGVMGLSAWSPPLSELGISERGLEFCEKLSSTYAFHRLLEERIERQVNGHRLTLRALHRFADTR